MPGCCLLGERVHHPHLLAGVVAGEQHDDPEAEPDQVIHHRAEKSAENLGRRRSGRSGAIAA